MDSTPDHLSALADTLSGRMLAVLDGFVADLEAAGIGDAAQAATVYLQALVRVAASVVVTIAKTTGVDPKEAERIFFRECGPSIQRTWDNWDREDLRTH